MQPAKGRTDLRNGLPLDRQRLFFTFLPSMLQGAQHRQAVKMIISGGSVWQAWFPLPPRDASIDALYIHGLKPRPMLMVETPHLFWFTVGNLFLANVFTLILGLTGIRITG